MFKKRWLLSAVSMCAACSLLASPAFADDGHGNGGGGGGGNRGGDDHGGRAAVTTTTTTTTAPSRGDGNGNGRGRDNGAAVAPATVNVRPAEVHVENEAAKEAAEAAREAAEPAENVAPAPVTTPVAVDNDDVQQLLGNVAEMDDDDAAEVAEPAEAAEAPEVHPFQVVSLATLTAGLAPADATAVTNAVNANTAALQAFLNGGTPGATALDAALNAASVNPGSVLAIFRRDGNTIVVTA